MSETIRESIIPQNDVQRVEALQRYKILDTPPEKSFTDIVHLMAEVFDVPIALISLVDKERVFFKGNVGMPGVENTAREVSLCSFAILSPEPTIFEKPLEEPCLLSNPLVHGSFGLRFYAGAPLITADGYNIGSICIVDKKERTFSQKENNMLVRFSRMVMHEIELRHTALQQAEAEELLRQSNKRFDLVAKATQDAIWDWNLITDEIWWNEGFKELFGYRAEEIEPTIVSWYNRVHPDDKDRVISGIHEVIDIGGKNWTEEYRFRRKDGSYAIVFDRGYALHDEQGRPYRMLGSMQDITERKQAEEALRKSQERLQKAVSIGTVGVIFFDLQGCIHDANAAFESMSGYSREDFRGGRVRWDKVTPPEFMEVTLKSREEFLTKWENTPYEKQYIRPDGSRWWGLFAGKRLSEDECVEFVVDITETKQTEEELEWKIHDRTEALAQANIALGRSNEELKRLNKNLEEFAYAASHDLKEPIRKIKVFADRLKESLEGRMSESEKGYFKRMEVASKRMEALIDDLLIYSEVSQASMLDEVVDLNNVLDCVLSDLDLEIEEKNAKIDVGRLFTVQGHRRQLQQAFQNLIGNALKYSKPDVPPVITVACSEVSGFDTGLNLRPEEQDKRFYQITIRDNGIGFEQEDAERIFNVFTRLHGMAEYKGSGIGLSIVRKVVENHCGFVTAEGNPGEGASFKIFLQIPLEAK